MDQQQSRSARAVQELRDALDAYVKPMFPGSEVRTEQLGRRGNKKVGWYKSFYSIKIQPDRNNEFGVAISRSQQFSGRERTIVEKFVNGLPTWCKTCGAQIPKYYASIMEAHLIDVIAQTVCGGSRSVGTVSDTLRTFLSWADQTYEGQRIAVSVGVEPEGSRRPRETVSVRDVARNDFAKVLSNGVDTLLVVSSAGLVCEHKNLTNKAPPPDVFAPLRYTRLASWASEGRVALSLNRNGEILVFSEGELSFAFRRGSWLYFAHESIMTQLGRWPPELQRAVYLSSLDVSFARCGGCVGVGRRDRYGELCDDLIQPEDLFGSEEAEVKPKCTARLLRGRPFQDVDRALRAELLGIDGAIVLDHRGNVLAVGAILKIRKGGGKGGGRLAAARSLAKYGLGVKISNDGQVFAFRQRKRGAREPPSLRFG